MPAEAAALVSNHHTVMRKKCFELLALACAGLLTSSALGGVAYPNPPGGWKYIYNGDKDTAGERDSGFTSLDGTWSHDNGSDEFDGPRSAAHWSPAISALAMRPEAS